MVSERIRLENFASVVYPYEDFSVISFSMLHWKDVFNLDFHLMNAKKLNKKLETYNLPRPSKNVDSWRFPMAYPRLNGSGAPKLRPFGPPSTVPPANPVSNWQSSMAAKRCCINKPIDGCENCMRSSHLQVQYGLKRSGQSSSWSLHFLE